MNLNNAVILVTGGCGFIGSNFIRHLLQIYPKSKIYNFDYGPYGHYAASGCNLDDVSGILHSYYHNSISSNALGFAIDGLKRKYPKKDFVVFHFAAESHVTRSEKNSAKFYETNFLGTQNIVNALLHTQKTYGSQNHLIHVSTDEIYGPAKNDVFFKEEDRKPGKEMATSHYAISKAMADDFVFKKSKTADIRTIIVRPTNNFGSWQFPEKYLPRSITKLLRGEKIDIWGDGHQVRDWLFVEDTCRAICLVTEKGQAGEVYNIGANHDPEISNAEMARKVLKLMNFSESRLRFKFPDPRPNHDERYAVNTAKIKELGWMPGNFDEQLLSTITWYQENQEWWRPLILEAERIYK